MRAHLHLPLKEAASGLEGRYEDSIAEYGKVHAQILAMADMLDRRDHRPVPRPLRGLTSPPTLRNTTQHAPGWGSSSASSRLA